MGSGDSPPSVVRATCEEARSQCDGALLESESKDLDRYYIPEENARRAEDLLRAGMSETNAFIVVSITQNGNERGEADQQNGEISGASCF